MDEEEYTPVQKKYNLPSFDELEREFDLLQADSEYVLKSIRKQMQEKIEFLADIFSDILQPSPESISQMHECQHVLDDDKELILKLYKELQFYLRKSHEANLINTDEINVDFIRDFAKEYANIKQKSLPIISKLKDSWKKELLTKQSIGYFG